MWQCWILFTELAVGEILAGPVSPTPLYPGHHCPSSPSVAVHLATLGALALMTEAQLGENKKQMPVGVCSGTKNCSVLPPL